MYDDNWIYQGESHVKQEKKIMRLGTAFLNLARRKRIGLETRIGYISPENNAGIWHGASVKSGFIETFSGKKTKRFWYPNVHEKEIYSDLLDEKIKTTFTAKALREIDNAGGFDNYIMRTSDKVLCSNFAIELKRRMETVERFLKHTDMKLEDIKAEVTPVKVSKHAWLPRTHSNRFYLDWKGPRKHMIFC